MGGLRPVSLESDRLASAALGRKARLLGRVVTLWRDIVGDELARKAVPERVRRVGKRGGYAVDLRVAGAFNHEIAHRRDAIIAQLNAHLGEGTITELKIRRTHASGLGQFAGRGRPRASLGRTGAGHGLDAAAPDRASADTDRLGRALAELGTALGGDGPSRR